MKYRLLSLLSILTITLGIKNTALADPIVHRANYQDIDSQTLISPLKSTSTFVTNEHSNLVAIHVQSGSSMTIAALERSIHKQIDRYRQSLNLPPLKIDPTVSAQARAHSEEMAQSGTLSHTMDSVDSPPERLLLGQTLRYRQRQHKYQTAAENVASIQNYPQPDLLAVQDWLASPAHKRHILGNYNLTGIGVAKNSQGEYFFTQIFVNK
jgi:uncharacterized protein YkwD